MNNDWKPEKNISSPWDVDVWENNIGQPVKPMTDTEKLKAQIKVLEKKLALLEEIEKTPIPKMELIKDGTLFCVDYNNVTYYRQEYRHSNGWIKWWRENDEGGILTRVDDAETFRLLEKLFSADIAANPDGSLKFMFGPKLYDVIADWWDEIFMNNNEAAVTIESLVDDIEKWLPKPQSAEGSQNAYVDCSVEGFNGCLTEIKGKLR